MKTRAAANAAYGTPETVQNYDYDKLGQAVKHVQSIGNQSYQLEYGYNLAGQMVSEKYPSGKIVNMAVDDFGRLSAVADSQRTYLSGVVVDARGLLSQINLGNGTSETYLYNDRFQMKEQELKKGSDVLQKYVYGYGQVDGNGVLQTSQNNGQLGTIESFIGASKQATQKFKYDQIGRLKESAEYRGDNGNLTYKQNFDFDRFGNLYRKAASNPTAGQQNPIAYTAIEDSDISKATNRFTSNTTYDDAGQVVSDNKFRSMNFAYDANGRQIKATRSGVPDAWTVYDALGNRVATKINNIWQYMVYDAMGKLIAEYGQTADGLGGVKYVQQDWQGSVRTVTNANGFAVARTDHQAFGGDVGYGVGQRTIDKGYNQDPATRQGYGLTERDEASGQDHTWFRKNENLAGRWTSPDPYNGSMSLGDPQSFNRYSYVGNDPTNFVDPSGLLIQSCRWEYESAVSQYDEDGKLVSYTAPRKYLVCSLFNIGNGPSTSQTNYPEDFGVGGATYDTITPKRGQDNHEGRCRALKKSIQSHVQEAERHLKNYGNDFYKWVHPFGNFMTGQLTDYQKHVDLVRSESMEYLMNCSDQGPPPPVPAFADVPNDIKEAGKKSLSRRIWDALPSLGPPPTKKQVEEWYKKYPSLFPIPGPRRIPVF